MLFLKLKYKVVESTSTESSDEEKPQLIIKQNADTTCVVLSECRFGSIVFGAATKAKTVSTALEACNEYLKEKDIKAELIDQREITATQFSFMLRKISNRYDFDENASFVTDTFGLELYEKRRPRGLDIKEKMILMTYSNSSAKSAVKVLLGSSLTLPEFTRIFTQKQDKFVGHPVHYILSAENAETALELCEILLGSLFTANRLMSRRYAFCSFDFRFGLFQKDTMQDLKALYSVAQGSTIVIDCNLPISSDAANDTNVMTEVSRSLKKLVEEYGQQTLTIFSFTHESAFLKDIFQKILANTLTVELSDDIPAGREAHNYLKNLADSYNLTERNGLYSNLDKNLACFHPSELMSYFKNWHNYLLQTKYFPQYAFLKPPASEVPPVAASGMTMLKNMIGLEEPKRIIQQILDYAKAQKLFAEKGLNSGQPSLHMVFSGNPGTAKTTFARLFAQIMKENGILSKGELIEVGRNDLVARYVGWTAKTVKAKFAEAKGSVLFIDEANSLLDDRAGSFGDEAINTIVHEMENAREDTIVVFAGYPSEMECFLSRNPGLSSRIAYHINFPDYNDEELFEIFRLMLQEQNLKLDASAIPRVKSIIASGCKQNNFGNGRYVRNILDKAKMLQASRLVASYTSTLSIDDTCTLKKEDLEELMATRKITDEKRSRIGFF